MTRLSALLAPEAAAKVRNTITNQAQRLLRDDQTNNTIGERTHQQRLADALVAICETPNGDSGKPSPNNEPLVIVAIQLADLLAGLDGVAYSSGPLAAETVRKLACEGAIIPAVFNSDGVVLDMGHKTRLATTNQRLALRTRYENQRAVPRCDRPFEWCHIHRWEHGGPTNLNNLIPVCTPHHTQIHDGRLQIQRNEGTDHWHRKPKPTRKLAA